MPTPEARAEREQVNDWRRYVDRELHRLRMQWIFVFVLLLSISVLLAVRSELAAAAIRQDRYNSCQQRVLDLTAYNAKLVATGQLPQPLPNCPPNPQG